MRKVATATAIRPPEGEVCCGRGGWESRGGPQGSTTARRPGFPALLRGILPRELGDDGPGDLLLHARVLDVEADRVLFVAEHRALLDLRRDGRRAGDVDLVAHRGGQGSGPASLRS